MGMNYGNVSKTSFQAEIKRKQQLFNRFKRRFKVANTPGERQFLKAEASRIVSELKQCNKKWKTWGFGACMWITKNFTVSNFTAGRTTSSRKTVSRKSSARRTTARKSSARTMRSRTRRSSTTRTKARSNSRTRSSASRRSYAAW
ncbi:MAG: hypothetical protein MI923_13170 [Phycisphaerales bacterium]|nr:hypothetical protein [Phycisphaerales bacterium]